MIQAPDIGSVVMHHTADAYSIGIEPFFRYSWHQWPATHIGAFTVNFTPTKHVIFLVIAALLVFLTTWIGGRSIQRRHQEGKGPRGFGAAVEALVLFVRDDIVKPSIGHDYATFAPYIFTLFVLILYCNLLGLIPHGSTPTGNLAVTAALAIISFFTIEISGFMKLGAKGYLRTIFPKPEGLSGVGATIMSLAMAPIEILGKIVKPFALAVRLFGNMTAGHFVILSLFGLIFLFGNLALLSWGIGLVTAALVWGIMFLELIVAFLQAYVFALLTSTFIGLMQHEH